MLTFKQRKRRFICILLAATLLGWCFLERIVIYQTITSQLFIKQETNTLGHGSQCKKVHQHGKRERPCLMPTFHENQKPTSMRNAKNISEAFSHSRTSQTIKNSIQLDNGIFKHSGCFRGTSYPFISGDTFRAMADHVFDETTVIDDWPTKVQLISDGELVFLKIDYLCEFFSLFNSFSSKFLLVTHNGDAYAPGPLRTFLLSDRLIAWFTSNPDFKHPKLHPIPIGLANTYVPHGNLATLTNFIEKRVKQTIDRGIFVYINFSLGTNVKQRTKALAHFRNFSRVRLADGRISFSEYLQDLGNSQFVVSPPGNGLDCHRTWEALAMGAIPIVLSSTLDPLFENASTLIVHSWEEVSEMSLSAKRMSIPTTNIPLVLTARYWYSKFAFVRGNLQ